VWEPNDRLPAPHDDPSREWIADLTDPSVVIDENGGRWTRSTCFDPEEIF
jgi:hypothetical protein